MCAKPRVPDIPEHEATLPEGWVTEPRAAGRLGVTLETVRRRRRLDPDHRLHIPFRRLPDGRIVVHLADHPPLDIPADWVSPTKVAAMWGVHVETVRRWYRAESIIFRRSDRGHVRIDPHQDVKDLLEGAHGHRKMTAEARQDAETRTSTPEIRRHMRWLENLVEQMQARQAADADERRRLLAIIDRLTEQR